jgi:YjbE family integral membrane protein
MDLFSVQALSAVLSIIMINLILSGDNAVVIALASRNLPGNLRNKAIFWGTFGAVVVRVILTIAILWLMKIPFMQLFGGILLVWIAYKLLAEEENHDETNIKGSKSLLRAIQTIIVADLVMSLDNVLAIAAAAEGHIPLIILGIAISIPIMVFGSTLIMKLMERFPIIIQVGVAILAYTAGEMILDDKKVHDWIVPNLDFLEWVIPLGLIVLVLFFGNLAKRKNIRSV